MSRLRATPGLTHLLSHVERRLTTRLLAVLAPEECSIEEWRVLELLADDEGHTMTEVAEYALLLAPTLTKLVDRLASLNLVYRRADPEDRRRVRVYLTPRGHDRYRRLSRHVTASEAQLLADDGDGATLTELLTRLRDALDEKPRAEVQ
jgi:DNA-binding MarR family transcriptional regulator